MVLARVVGDNGTLYCLWGYNVRNCEDGEWFLNVHLANMALSCLGFILLLAFLLQMTLVQKLPIAHNGQITGWAGLVLVYLVYAINWFIFSSVIYTDANHGSAYILVSIGLNQTLSFCGLMLYFYSLFGVLKIIAPNNSANLTTIKCFFVIYIVQFGAFAIGATLGLAYLIDNDFPAQNIDFSLTNGIAAGEIYLFALLLLIPSYKFFLMVDTTKFGHEDHSIKLKQEIIKIKGVTIVLEMAMITFATVFAIDGLAIDMWSNLPFSKAMCVISLASPSSLTILVPIASWIVSFMAKTFPQLKTFVPEHPTAYLTSLEVLNMS